MNRRQFATSAALGFAGILLAGTEGCNSEDVWHEIEGWVPVGIQAFESVVALVAPLAAPGIDAIATMVEAGFSAVAAAIDAYLNAPAADKATFAQKLILAFQSLTGQIQNFLTALGQSSNPIVKVAVMLIGIIVSTIEGFLNQIMPAPPANATFKVGERTIEIPPVRRSRKTFISQFNEQCVASGHPELELPQVK
jgi:hypothetical protein